MVRIKEVEHLVGWSNRARKHPPPPIEIENGGVHPWALENVFFEAPFGRKRFRSIEPDRIGLIALRDHEEFTFDRKHIWIGEMKKLSEHNLLVIPSAAVSADSQPNLPFPGLCVHYFKEHVPGILHFDHEGISHELRG